MIKKLANNYFWIAIVILYVFTRLINLKIMPIFTDEAIYSYWAQIALNDPAHRYISMVDGKQPLFIWLAAIMQRFIADPLIASRLVSVMAGFTATIGIFLVAKTLFNEKIAKIAAILYVILPFTLIYDRMALYDSLLTAIGIYTLYLSLKLAKNPLLDIALINGFILGLGQITKSSANFFLALLPAALLLFDFNQKGASKKLLKWGYLTFTSIAISTVMYNALRLSPLFYIIEKKNHEFIRSTSDVIKNPFLHFSGNLDSITGWFLDYNGIPFVILFCVVSIWGVYRLKKPVLILLFYILTPFTFELFFNQVLYPRFSLFYFPYVIILVSVGMEYILSQKKPYVFFALILILVIPLYSSFRLLSNPPKSLITKSDKNQYLNEWPAGYGVQEVVDFLKIQARDQNVYVGTEGTFGLLPFALQIYFWSDNRIQIEGYWPVNEIPQQVLDAAKTKKTYFVFNEKQNILDNPDDPHLKFIAKYQKGNGSSYMRLYEVIP